MGYSDGVWDLVTGATGPAVGAGAGLCNVLHNSDLSFSEDLTLKSLLKCLNVGLRFLP